MTATEANILVSSLILQRNKALTSAMAMLNSNGIRDLESMCVVYNRLLSKIATAHEIQKRTNCVHRLSPLIPYRRREFETDAMISEIFATCQLKLNSGVERLTNTKNLSYKNIPVILYKPTGEHIIKMLTTVSLESEHCISFRVIQPADDVILSDTDTHLVILLTPGILDNPISLKQVITGLQMFEENRCKLLLLYGNSWRFSDTESLSSGKEYPIIRMFCCLCIFLYLFNFKLDIYYMVYKNNTIDVLQ